MSVADHFVSPGEHDESAEHQAGATEPPLKYACSDTDMKSSTFESPRSISKPPSQPFSLFAQV